jgi:hypothetical protein
MIRSMASLAGITCWHRLVAYWKVYLMHKIDSRLSISLFQLSPVRCNCSIDRKREKGAAQTLGRNLANPNHSFPLLGT